MKRASSTYRLQLIKEVATRHQRQLSNDPMANYIQQLLDSKPELEHPDINRRFNGNHFDERVGGWVSDHWGLK
ncbi:MULTISPECIES: hypothetical protein [Vibrio]|uniref:Uncharacterized protein n=1 Tax=Vibrio aestuarianus TaxID=28171 RepID=A0A7X6N704_9VIBR|nr:MULTISPECIES: hypothetical protein [Vibrio]KOE82583.1 hypothetical protein ACS86_07040 [Vibrio alginolyticus]MDE1208735.1 hypothetical protein [Vibrio aestuarianus]MDE1215244.1 hypothetical protein [Vibrio aestuarianus]MDE1217057.1 hypothetical protein [Vibrio aestuarianus]MDE1219538.1 hypothetical protein [Vibrio aestuarianus]